MKRFMVLLLAVAFALCCSNLAFAANAMKIGYANVAKIFDEYQKTKESDKTLEEESGKKQSDREKMVNDIKRLKDELELMSDKGKTDKQVQIDEKVKVLQDFDKATRDTLTKKRDDYVRDILKEIEDTVNEYAQKEAYTFIFNDRILLFKAKEGDITEAIIKVLNDRYTSKKK